MELLAKPYPESISRPMRMRIRTSYAVSLQTLVGIHFALPDGKSGFIVLSGKQDEKSTSIRMRECRRMRDEGRA